MLAEHIDEFQIAAASLSRASSMLMAERKGTRVPASRSKRGNSRTGLSAMVSSRQFGHRMPAFFASVRATASQTTVFTSSLLLGNLAIARCPSRSRTEAFGLAPPSDDPGANRSRRSSSLSYRRRRVRRQRAVAAGRSTAGFSLGAWSARNGPPSFSAKRSAPCRASSSTSSR